MLVRAARPTASSTFCGYRYVPAGDSGSVGPGGERLDRRESGRGIRREGARKREREPSSEARKEHQGALRLRTPRCSPKGCQGRCEFAQLPPAPIAARPEGRAPVLACTTVLVFAGKRGSTLSAVQVCAALEDV